LTSTEVVLVKKQKRPNTVQPLGGIEDPAKSEGPIGAAPVRGARSNQELPFFFLLAPFFFFAMSVFLSVGVNSAGLVQVAGLIALDLSLALASLPRGTMTQSQFPPQSKNANSAYFSVT
jgi:hypothetical protein